MKQRHIRRARAAAVLLTGAALAGDQSPAEPKSPAAVAAIQQADAAQKIAQETYDAAMFRAKKDEVEELRTALKVATKKEDLDEANAIAATVKSIELQMNTSAAPSATANSSMLGRWRCHFEGRDILWNISPEWVRHSEDGGQTGVPTVQGHILLVKWPNGCTNRLTFMDERFYVESWSPGHSTTEPAQSVAVAVQNAAGK